MIGIILSFVIHLETIDVVKMYVKVFPKPYIWHGYRPHLSCSLLNPQPPAHKVHSIIFA